MPRFVRTISIGYAAYDVLKLIAAGEVHSIFNRTFNVLVGDKLIGVARSDVARSPTNLIVDVRSSVSMSSLGIRKGVKARMGNNRMLIGDVLEITLRTASLWRPKTCADGHIDFEVIGRNLTLAKQLAARASGREGLGQLLPYIDEIASGAMPRVSDSSQVVGAALPHLVKLARHVRIRDIRGIERSAQKLVGLGPGLSPSADDALAGFMVALWWVANSLGGNLGFVRAINETIAGQRTKTTLMSQQLLEHSAIGETNEAVERFLESILVGTASDVKVGVRKISVMGETSGIDTAVGILLGLNLGLSMHRPGFYG